MATVNTDERKRESHVLLLTAAPGTGKTTVMRRLAASLGDKRIRGFYTAEIRDAGRRIGFSLVSFSGSERIIAHVDFPKAHRVGKYGVDVAAIDEAVELLKPDAAASAYLVDEIGKMECLSERFVAGMRALTMGRTPLVATVALKGGGFIAEVKRMHPSNVWTVTPENRDEMPARVAAWLSRTRSRRSS